DIALMASSEGFRVADTQDTGRPGLVVQRPREGLVLLPLIDVRQDFPLDETPHRVAHPLMGGVEIIVQGGPGRLPARLLRPYRALAWFSRGVIRHNCGGFSAQLPAARAVQRIGRTTLSRERYPAEHCHVPVASVSGEERIRSRNSPSHSGCALHRGSSS